VFCNAIGFNIQNIEKEGIMSEPVSNTFRAIVSKEFEKIGVEAARDCLKTQKGKAGYPHVCLPLIGQSYHLAETGYAYRWKVIEGDGDVVRPNNSLCVKNSSVEMCRLADDRSRRPIFGVLSESDVVDLMFQTQCHLGNYTSAFSHFWYWLFDAAT